MVGGAYFRGTEGAVWGLAASLALTCTANEVEILSISRATGVHYRLQAFWAERRLLWEFSLPAVLSGLMNGPAMWAANAMLVHQAGGYAELGIYNAASRIKQVPELVLAMLTMPLLPVLSEQLGRKALAEYRKTLQYAFALTWYGIVPVSTLQIMFPNLTVWAFGAGYRGHGSMVQWLMLQACMVGLFSPLATVVASVNRMWLAMAINAWWAVVFIACSVALVPVYHATGLAAAFALASLVSSASFLMYLRWTSTDLLTDIPVLPRFASLVITVPLAAGAYHFRSNVMMIAVAVLAVLLILKPGLWWSSGHPSAISLNG